tara:strand:+ start:477 stop:626 length:150 start_codon:yes stop_codon:yes gene_type:complete
LEKAKKIQSLYKVNKDTIDKTQQPMQLDFKYLWDSFLKEQPMEVTTNVK